MAEQTKIAKVWTIINNELTCKDKKVITVNFNDVEITILKEERKFDIQGFLIKDKNNEYWDLGIAPIKFKLFENNESLTEAEQARVEEYKRDITNAYKSIDLKSFWQKKINQDKYFNKCELEYIRRYYPDIYEKAKESRRIYEENRDMEREQEKQKQIQEERAKVQETNERFKKELKQIKNQIFMGETVKVKNFEFYRDDKYENGLTIQNNILYLAKVYKINIPLATQGFINNRLVSYNFRNGNFSYNVTKNKKPSVKMHYYLEQIYEKVKEEYQVRLGNKKKKIIEAR